MVPSGVVLKSSTAPSVRRARDTRPRHAVPPPLLLLLLLARYAHALVPPACVHATTSPTRVADALVVEPLPRAALLPNRSPCYISLAPRKLPGPSPPRIGRRTAVAAAHYRRRAPASMASPSPATSRRVEHLPRYARYTKDCLGCMIELDMLSS
ncbi:uncharacterized protein LOC120662972 [Panicum virgatum]|uniref:uncharacterized protein LOC120662972 n=1 Tax=Panicum virgatum TaxID=38727 RepID=UPI0019D5C101|nr:uncharacterized protein LOC120662972 [Panicum virgatum]